MNHPFLTSMVARNCFILDVHGRTRGSMYCLKSIQASVRSRTSICGSEGGKKERKLKPCPSMHVKGIDEVFEKPMQQTRTKCRLNQTMGGENYDLSKEGE